MKNKITKPKWFKAAIESKDTHVACGCCGGATDILPLDTKLYYGFGGWVVNKNGAGFFMDGRDVEFEQYKDLRHVEEMIGEDSINEYVADFDSPLRSARYQRHAKNAWVLIETGLGFA